MRRLGLLLAVLVAVWAMLEIAAIPLAGAAIEQQAIRRTGGATTVEAAVGSFPLLTRYVLTGRIADATITFGDVRRSGLTFARVRFALRGIAIDRASLLRRRPRVTAIDAGSVTAVIDLSALPTRVSAAAARSVRVSRRTLFLGPLSFPLSADLLPCNPTATTSDRQVVISCGFAHVPAALALEAVDTTSNGVRYSSG